MAYLTTIDLVQGDQLPEIEITLKDSNTSPAGVVLDADDPTTFAALDLTGGSVRMRVRTVGQTGLIDTLIGTVTAATEGKVTFIFDSDTLASAGVLEGEIEFTDSGGRTQTVIDLIKLKVRSQFG